MPFFNFIYIYIFHLFPDEASIPQTLCLAWFSLDVLFTSSTICHLCMISVDRYIACSAPLRHTSRPQHRHTLLKICGVWVLSILIAGPLFLISTLDTTRSVGYKGCGPETTTFILTATITSFYVPLFIMAFMYVLTVLALNKQGKSLQKLVAGTPEQSSLYVLSQPTSTLSQLTSVISNDDFGRQTNDSDTVTTTLLDVPKQNYRLDMNDSNRQHKRPRDLPGIYSSIGSRRNSATPSPRSLRSERPSVILSRHRSSYVGCRSYDNSRRAVKVLGILFAVFVVFYLPFFATYVINALCLQCQTYLSARIITVFEWLAYSASMVNPIIYHVFSPDFRRAFYKVLRCQYQR